MRLFYTKGAYTPQITHPTRNAHYGRGVKLWSKKLNHFITILSVGFQYNDRVRAYWWVCTSAKCAAAGRCPSATYGAFPDEEKDCTKVLALEHDLKARCTKFE